MNTGIRKAAVFLSGLDWETADHLLNRLERAEAQAIRNEMVRLHNVSEEEITQTAEAFLQSTRFEVVTDRYSGSLSHHSVSDSGFCMEGPSQPEVSPSETQEPLPPHRFDFLETLTPYQTALFLVDESPQVIAVVLSGLTPQYSGEVILCFEQSFRMELIQRLANLNETDEMILDEIEQSLKSRFFPVETAPVKQNGRTIIKEILKHVDKREEQEILAGLGELQYFPDDEQESGLTFEHLSRLEDYELGLLYRRMNDDIAVMSLVGADEGFVARVFRQYPVHEQPHIHQLFVHFQQIPTEEIVYARECVLRGAIQFIHEGAISNAMILMQ